MILRQIVNEAPNCSSLGHMFLYIYRGQVSVARRNGALLFTLLSGGYEEKFLREAFWFEIIGELSSSIGYDRKILRKQQTKVTLSIRNGFHIRKCVKACWNSIRTRRGGVFFGPVV